MYKTFDISAETFAKNYAYTIKVNNKDHKIVLWIRIFDIQKRQVLKTFTKFTIWLIKKLKVNLRLIIPQNNKLKSIKEMHQN